MARKNTIEVVINAKDNASRVISGIGGHIQSLGKLALVGLGALGTAAAAAGVGIAKLAIDAAPLEQVRAAFDGLTESVNVGSDVMLAALQKGSAGMISQRDLMLTFNKAASLVGIQFAQQLPEAFGYLGKVAAATGEDMGFMLNSLVTGVGRLSPMILDNLSIQVDLTAAYEDYAKEVGKSTDELTKSEQQTALMNQVMVKLAENTATMPDVTGSAAQGMAAFRATIEDLKDRIGLAFLPILQKVLSWFTKAAERVLPVFIATVENVASVLDSLIDYFVAVLTEGDPLNDFLTHLPEPIRDIVRSVGEFIVNLTNLAKYFAIVFEEGDYLNDLLTHLPEPIRDIVASIGKFVAAAIPVIRQIADWIAEHVKLEDVLIALGIAIAAVIIPAIISIATSIAPVVIAIVALIAIVAALRTAWETDFLGIRTALTNFWYDYVKPAFEQLVVWLKTNIPVAIQTLKGFWENTLLPAIKTVWSFIQDNLVPLLNALVGWLGTAIPDAVNVVRRFFVEVWLPAMQRNWEFIQQYILPILNDLAQWLGDNLPVAIEVLKGFWENVLLPALETIWAFIQNDLFPLLNTLHEWLMTNLPAAIETLRGFWENILLPAIEAVWGFIDQNLIPLFKALVELWNVQVTLALTMLAGLWENVLQPALETVWSFIQNSIIPIFNTVISTVRDSLMPPLRTLSAFLSVTLNAAFAGVKLVIGWVIDKINAFKTALKNLKNSLPDWLTPGSASPFEMVLLGINDAIKHLVTVGIPRLIDAMHEAGGSVGDTISRMFDLASAMGGLGSTAASRWVDPLRKNLDIINKAIAQQKKMLEDTTISEEQRVRITTTLQHLEQQRMKTAWDLAQAVKKVTELRKQQADLQYLQQQIKLLDLIKQYKLKPEDILGGLKLGLDAEASEVAAAMARAMQAVLRAAEEELEISSHSKVFMRMGAEVMLGFVAGLATQATEMQSTLTDAFRAIGKTIEETARQIFNLGSAISGLGMTAAKRWLDPLEKKVKLLDDLIEETGKKIQEREEMGAPIATLSERLLRLEKERAEAAGSLADAERQVMDLRKKQADLQFLQQQIKLLDLIKEYELSPEAILGGLELGLDAEMNEIVAAMNRAMQAVLDAARRDLEISSPSRAFMRMGREAMAGFIAGFTGGAGDFPNVTRLVGAGGNNYDNRTTNVFNQTVTTRATRANVMRDFEFARALYA